MPHTVALYAPFLDSLPINGISISVRGSQRESTICVSDSQAARIDELHYALGEGPHWQALRTGRPSLVGNVATADHSEWPMFADALTHVRVGALFSFPLLIAGKVVGVADMYRTAPGPFGTESIEAAQALAAIAAPAAVQLATASAQQDRPRGSRAPELRREVQQATGMVLVQLGLSASDAFLRLQAHAFSTGRTLREVSNDVVARRLDFRQLPD